MNTVAARPLTERAAVLSAKAIGRISRLWKQRGLGTIFDVLQRVPPLADLRSTIEFEPGLFFETEVFEPYWGPVVLGGRSYEPELRFTLDRVLAPDVTWIDGGANYGYWSIIATRPNGGARRGIAVEPAPRTLERLRRNCELNGSRFVCAPYALDAVSGEKRTLTLMSTHAATRLTVGTETAKGASVDVETICIDDLLSKHSIDPGTPFVVKLDVEGTEIAALNGAQKSRSSADHAIIVEDWPMARYPVAAFLLAEGYALFHVSKTGKATRIASVDEAFAVAHPERGPKHPENFVAARATGRFGGILTRWAAER